MVNKLFTQNRLLSTVFNKVKIKFSKNFTSSPKTIFNAVLAPTIIVATLALTGCATLMSSDYKYVTVNTKPEKAKIDFANQTYTAPALIYLDNIGVNSSMVVSKDGYVSQTVPFKRTLNPWVFGNIVLLPLAPIGLAIDIYQQKLFITTPNKVYAKLEPDTGKDPKFGQEPVAKNYGRDIKLGGLDENKSNETANANDTAPQGIDPTVSTFLQQQTAALEANEQNKTGNARGARGNDDSRFYSFYYDRGYCKEVVDYSPYDDYYSNELYYYCVSDTSYSYEMFYADYVISDKKCGAMQYYSGINPAFRKVYTKCLDNKNKNN